MPPHILRLSLIGCAGVLFLWYTKNMRHYFTRPVLELALMQFLSYFIVTFNYRAVAEVSYMGTFVTDVLIAALAFSSIKRVAEATTWHERVGYIVGGSIGAQIALFLSTYFFRG
jgi:predicted alpha/beta hydrolase